MGSVVTYWSGRLNESSDQVALTTFLTRLAKLSESCFNHEPVKRSSFLEKITTQSESSIESQRPNIVFFDQAISGRIFVGNSMLLLEQLDKPFRKSASRIEKPDGWPSDPANASLAIFSREDDQRYAVQVPAFRLYGITFRLYDPRRLYPGEDTMSFTFLHAPDFHAFDGQLVHAYPRIECAQLDGELIQQADWYLETPSIHLRYYLEEWFDLLMTWIKIFYMPELEYWRNELLNRFHEIKEPIDRLISSEGREQAKEIVFEYLLESFTEEADRWQAEIAKDETALDFDGT